MNQLQANPTPHRPFRRPLLPAALLLAAAGLLAPAVAPPAQAADDRALFSAGTEAPYLFILLDTSGSMHWTPPCDDEDGCPYVCPLSDELCADLCPVHICIDPSGGISEQETCDPGETSQYLCETGDCPDGDCYARLAGDDPRSKLFQAKNAIYRVIKQTQDEKIPLNLGFATFNQDTLRLEGKHWLYEQTNDGVNIGNGVLFPPLGSEQVFGRTYNCHTSGNGDNVRGLAPDAPLRLDRPYEVYRVFRCPQLGQDGNSISSGSRLIYVRNGGNTYRVQYRPESGESLGAEGFEARVRVHRCTNGSCTTGNLIDERVLTYELLSDYDAWDFSGLSDNVTDFDPPALNSAQLGFFTQGIASDSPASNTCAGWDPNDDTFSDRHDGLSIRFPNGPSDARGSEFRVGDVIPLDWLDDHKQDILERMAPNLAPGGASGAFPDFRVATYFRDRTNSDGNLELRDEDERPITAFGSTPLGASVDDFNDWYDDWRPIAADEEDGDPLLGCRQIYLLVITDGDETCDGDPCAETASLYGNDPDSPDVQTFVVGFGLPSGGGNTLRCMPKYLVGEDAFDDPDSQCVDDVTGDSLFNEQGICEKPFFANNQEELVQQISRVIQAVTATGRAFATAAVPQVQATVADKVYLSNFVPVQGEPYWDGHLNSFLRPLPLDEEGRPDTSSSRFLWDAGQVLADTQFNEGDPLGNGVGQRRVYYSLFNETPERPGLRRLFDPTSDGTTFQTLPLSTVRYDLWRGMEISFTPGVAQSEADAEVEANRVIDELLTVKTYDNPDLGEIDYLMGDIFHSDPVLVGNPPDSLFFTLNLKDNGAECGDDAAGQPSNPGYRCYALKHQLRRKMLVAGSNEGMLHAFDAGVFRGDDLETGDFDNGTGKELFAFVPRTVLPGVRALTLPNAGHRFTVDGTVTAADVFIDPEHNGRLSTDPPADDEREWRTVMIGGLRRGGRGMYSLDVTQPDRIDGNGVPQPTGGLLPSCAGGEEGTSNNASDCGVLPFPSVLWEYTDSVTGIIAGVRHDLDEEPADAFGNPLVIEVGARSEPLVGKSARAADGSLLEARADLGQTWSQPVVGRILMCGDANGECDPTEDDNDVAERFVAIFGGGFDLDGEHERGNWIYMLDIETGQTLYKRPVLGSVPTRVAAIDTNLDGFLDRVYFGTTRGFLYRIDIETVGGEWPAVVNTTVEDIDGIDHSVQRIPTGTWDPWVLFDANDADATSVNTLVRSRPIYLQPTVVFLADENAFAVSFGTGNRDDLWRGLEPGNDEQPEGRLFTFLDNRSFGDAPLTEDNLQQVTVGGADVGLNSNFLDAVHQGWYLELAANERLTSVPFSLAGVLIFNTYTPDEDAITIDDSDDQALCQRNGFSRVYGTFLRNGDALLVSGGTRVRFTQIDDFVTEPYTELGQTKNPGDDGGPVEPASITSDQAAITEALRQLMPPYCKFNNHTININVSRSDQGQVLIAPVPVCMVEKNFREL